MLGLGGLPGLGGPPSGDGGDAEAGEGNNLDVPAGCNMGRRRSRAVLYQLSGHYKPEKGGVKTKLKLGNVSIPTGGDRFQLNVRSVAFLVIAVLIIVVAVVAS